jgi:hypothetical protein
VEERSAIVIDKGILQPDQQYYISITVADLQEEENNPDCTTSCRVVKSLQFTADGPDLPTDGFWTVTPEEGSANSYIVAYGEWQSSYYPLEVTFSCSNPQQGYRGSPTTLTL